jgi:hypothetical protein
VDHGGARGLVREVFDGRLQRGRLMLRAHVLDLIALGFLWLIVTEVEW